MLFSSNNQVQSNFIGTDSSSAPGLGNGGAGIVISSGSHNTIGGTVAQARNVISGNSQDGVTINGSPAEANQIKGNFIGTSTNGMSALKNNFSGIAIIGSSASNNIVGGTEAGARNVISGNGTQGIYLNAPTYANSSGECGSIQLAKLQRC